ncbi:uncharacterized protein IL334_005016 [Kwoniella shivajii]|uniref:Matrin-type domain-containing protein n=1 Tax=Kwoniella shivajii TaxID=564305 RepID=A0ABZ1D2F2_9TREE|nr:hypothetical protein IL334_005016 [Kwoniella shivajii]
MTEYWVSKKQYFCKYCNIYIRDDAPSRKQHETGLKHIGNVERYIRDLYKTGAMAKKDKAVEAAEMARIEASAAAAYAHDTLNGAAGAASSSSKPSILQSLPSSASSTPPPRLGRDKPKDKYSNYTTAADLGFEEIKTAYEIQKELKNEAGQPSAWQTVELTSSLNGDGQEGKRKWQGEEGEEDEEANWKFDHNKKKPMKDLYDDDFDPKALKGLKVKKKEEKLINDKSVKEEDVGLNRNNWTGRLELNPPPIGGSSDAVASRSDREGMVYIQGNGWVKNDQDQDQQLAQLVGDEEEKKPILENGAAPTPTSVKGSLSTDESTVKISNIDVKPLVQETAGASSMFKKRRPPPSSRKK